MAEREGVVVSSVEASDEREREAREGGSEEEEVAGGAGVSEEGEVDLGPPNMATSSSIVVD